MQGAQRVQFPRVRKEEREHIAGLGRCKRQPPGRRKAKGDEDAVLNMYGIVLRLGRACVLSEVGCMGYVHRHSVLYADVVAVAC